jgi:hypothetical protein
MVKYPQAKRRPDWFQFLIHISVRGEQERMMKSATALKGVSCGFLAAALFVGSIVCPAQEAAPSAQSPASANSSLYLKVQLDQALKLSKLKAGDTVEGKLARDVYSSDRELFPAGSPVRLVVDHLERRRRERNDHWPWVVNAFTPRHQNYPAFKMATISKAGGETTLPVSLISISRRREVYAQAKKKKNAQDTAGGTVEVSKTGGIYGPANLATPMMILEAFEAGSGEASASAGAAASSRTPTEADVAGLETLPAGTVCKILLLGTVSASKSKPGDTVQGRLIEPVLSNSKVILPAGTLFEGTVVKKMPPRWGSRAGSLALTFNGVTLPGGNVEPLAASLTGAELDRRSHTRIDSEGQLRGERPGKAWMAINIGVTAGLAKEADDTLQLIIEAIVSTATDASTAGVGRIVATTVSGIFMVTRHGRDVVIPRFTEMNISLDRPLSVTRNAEDSASTAVVHGN